MALPPSCRPASCHSRKIFRLARGEPGVRRRPPTRSWPGHLVPRQARCYNASASVGSQLKLVLELVDLLLCPLVVEVLAHRVVQIAGAIRNGLHVVTVFTREEPALVLVDVNERGLRARGHLRCMACHLRDGLLLPRLY